MNVSFLCVFRWVPFEVASPRLDKKSYVILSEIANSQNQCSLLPHASETLAEPITSEHEDMEQGEANDHFMGCSDGDEEEEEDDDEMYETESEDPESKDNDINNILIGLYGSQYRYKVKETPFLRSLLKLFRCHQCLPLSSNSHVDNETKKLDLEGSTEAHESRRPEATGTDVKKLPQGRGRGAFRENGL